MIYLCCCLVVVCKEITPPTLEGAVSYELGSNLNIRATWPADEISQYRMIRWEIQEFINDNVIYQVIHCCMWYALTYSIVKFS